MSGYAAYNKLVRSDRGRPQTITRRNSLFAGRARRRTNLGDHRNAAADAKMNNVDSLAWLALTLQRIANG
ncbi:hypothetical protein ACVI1L_004919 [Bradyrhizobium sp. USDA 4516]